MTEFRNPELDSKHFPMLRERAANLTKLLRYMFNAHMSAGFNVDNTYPEYDEIHVNNDYAITFYEGNYCLHRIEHSPQTQWEPEFNELGECHFYSNNYNDVERRLVADIAEDFYSTYGEYLFEEEMHNASQEDEEI